VLQLLGPVTLRGVEALVQGIGFWYTVQQFCLHQLHSTKKAAGELRDERLRKRSGRREGRMQHAGLRDTAQSSQLTRATVASGQRPPTSDICRRKLFVFTF